MDPGHAHPYWVVDCQFTTFTESKHFLQKNSAEWLTPWPQRVVWHWLERGLDWFLNSYEQILIAPLWFLVDHYALLWMVCTWTVFNDLEPNRRAFFRRIVIPCEAAALKTSVSVTLDTLYQALKTLGSRGKQGTVLFCLMRLMRLWRTQKERERYLYLTLQ